MTVAFGTSKKPGTVTALDRENNVLTKVSVTSPALPEGEYGVLVSLLSDDRLDTIHYYTVVAPNAPELMEEYSGLSMLLTQVPDQILVQIKNLGVTAVNNMEITFDEVILNTSAVVSGA